MNTSTGSGRGRRFLNMGFMRLFAHDGLGYTGRDLVGELACAVGPPARAAPLPRRGVQVPERGGGRAVDYTHARDRPEPKGGAYCAKNDSRITGRAALKPTLTRILFVFPQGNAPAAAQSPAR